MKVRSGRANMIPSDMRRIPAARQSAKAVWTVCSTDFSSFEPMKYAAVTFTPLPNPISIPVNKNRSCGVEPTEPKAAVPAKCPATAMSTMLKST